MKVWRLALSSAVALLLCISLAGMFSPPLSAQSNYGSVAGSVSDPTGAAIADAQVSLSNTENYRETRTTQRCRRFIFFREPSAGPLSH